MTALQTNAAPPALPETIRQIAGQAGSVEDALRAVLSSICSRTGWQAGRIEFAPDAGDLGSRIVWHLEAPDRLQALRRLAEARRGSSPEGLARKVLQEGKPAFIQLPQAKVEEEGAGSDAMATYAFPAVLRKRVVAALEFFASDARPAAPALVESVGLACAEVGALIETRPALDALRRAERDYKDLFESAGEALLVLDAELSVVLDANPRAAELCGYPYPELAGSSVLSLWKTRPPPLAAEEGCRFETLHRRRDGSEVLLEVTASQVRFRKQRAVLVLLRAVSERERVLESLRASVDRYRLLFESSPQPLWVHDAETLKFLAVNDAAVREYGWPRARFLELRVPDLREPSEDEARPGQEWPPMEPSWSAAVQRHRTASGEVRDVELSAHDILFEGRRARLVAVTDVTKRRQAQARLLHAAFYDGLTGLPNRALFRERLEVAYARARRRDSVRCAVLFLDLDRFKLVNDSLGHRAGDELLIQIARRLEGCGRKGDTVARLGGDEFTLLVEDIADEQEAVHVAERVHRALAAPFRIEGHEVFANVSIGIALGGPSTELAENLLRDADTAMYRAKARGSRHALYDSSMHRHALEALQLENELRHAIDRKELRVVFQPIVDLGSGKLEGVEALVRWQHKDRGLVLPGNFIPLAEETGLIVSLGRWVMEDACAQARALPRASLSVNLSGHQLRQPDLVDQIQQMLARTGFPAARLRLELTESTLIETGQKALQTLDRLRALGARLCIDDFGTGYSSLSYLHQMPIDVLKIDASFVRAMVTDERKIKIVESILLLGKGLHIEVVAEGVETEEQASLLRRLGCERAQGYLFSRPASIEHAAAMEARG